jgi:hypothetical protein
MGNFTCMEPKKTINQIPTYFPCTSLNSQTTSFYGREQNIRHQTSDFMEILRCMNVKTQSL